LPKESFLIFVVKKAVFWGVSAYAVCACGALTPPDGESRKFDIHACEASMNIKFPVFFLRAAGTYHGNSSEPYDSLCYNQRMMYWLTGFAKDANNSLPADWCRVSGKIFPA
jgi:hypothetical protein